MEMGRRAGSKLGLKGRWATKNGIGSLHRQRWRRRAARVSPEARNISTDLDHLVIDSGNVTTLHTGEGSVPAEDRLGEGHKACENNTSFLVDAKSEKKDDMEKGSETDGSFFDCNICLDLARDPVVTCCGHLFCWPCLYQWLHIHSDVKECPVCKGEVSIKTVTPIYGRGNSTCRPEEDLTLKIPMRPNARRVETRIELEARRRQRQETRIAPEARTRQQQETRISPEARRRHRQETRRLRLD